MRILLISFLFGFTYLFPISLFSQSTNSNTSTIPIYTSKLFERQLIQYAYDGSPNPKTGVFSGVVTNYHLDNEYGFADFRLNTYSAPKPAIYSFIILSTSELIDNPIFPKNFSDDLMNIWIKFSDTYQKDKYEKIFITDKSQYSKLLDSLDKKLTPYYSYIDSIGVNILDNIQSRYTSVTLSKTQIVRNTKVSKLEANKFWETSFSLFDVYDDKLITLELGSPPYYYLFIYSDSDNIDSLINVIHSDIENGYSLSRHNRSYTPNKLTINNGIKFKNIDNFLKWAKVKYPEKFVNTQVNKSQTLTNTEQSKNVEPSENKNLSAFLKLLASSPSNTSTTNLKGSKNCIECDGTGKCRICNKTFQKPYFINGFFEKRSETKIGYILCNLCSGKGVKERNIGSRYEVIGYCSNEKCQDGWIRCYRCNQSGQRKNIGQCNSCYGTGRK